MSVQTTQGLASRLGYGLGRGVRFILTDPNVVRRWVKRGFFAVFLLFVAFNFGRDLVGGFITLTILVVAVVAFMRVSSSITLSDHKSLDWSHHPSIPRDGPDGYGYYDGHGNFRGSNNPLDDK